MTTYQIWYMRPEYFRNGIMGYDFCEYWGRLPDPRNLDKTHIWLMDMVLDNPVNLEAIYKHMQGENWSPNGEARPLIEQKGLRHTSMSMGDVVVVDGTTHMVDSFGFKPLEG